MTAFGGGGTPFTGGGGTAFGGGGVPFGGVGGIPGVRGGAKKPKRDLAALLQDIEDMVGGLINAPVALTKATAKTFGADVDSPDLGDIGGGIVESYKDMYGPAARGDWGVFLDKLREHPLQPILDVATIATAGGAGVGKLGQLAAKSGAGESALTRYAGYVAQTPESLSAFQKAGGAAHELAATPGLVPKARLLGQGTVAEGQEIARLLPRNPLVRARKEAVRGTLDAASSKVRLGPLSTAARDSRAFRREHDRRGAQILQRVLPEAERTAGKLNRSERAAYPYVLQGLDPDEFVANVLTPQLGEAPAHMRPAIQAEIRTLTGEGGVADLIRDPQSSPKLMAAADRGRELVAHQQGLAISKGLLDEGGIEERAYMPLRVQSGARHVEQTGVRDEALAGERREAFDAAKAHRDDVFEQYAEMGAANLKKRAAAQRALDRARTQLDEAEGDVETTNVLEGGLSIDEIRAAREAAGLPEPVYFPHGTAQSLRSKGPVGKAAGGVLGKPNQRKIGEQKRNEAFNLTHSRYARDPEALFESSRRVLKMVEVSERFSTMLRLSQEVGAREAIEAKWVPLNDARIKNMGRKLDEAASTLGALRTAFEDTDELAKLQDEYLQGLTLTKQSAEEAAGGVVRAVPPELYRAMIGDLDRVGVLAKKFDQVTDVWRAVVLPLRPAWIVNNAVGNNILLGLRGNPWEAAQRIPRAVAALRGEAAALDAIKTIGKTREYDQVLLQQLRERMPEVISSGQVRRETGRVDRRTGGQPLGSLRQAGNQLVRAGVKGVDVATEVNAVLTDDLPRIVAYLTEMDKHVAKSRALPEFAGMTDSAIAEHLLANDAFAGRISRQIMGDLLDYGALSNAERTYARRLIPFYAWNRLITEYTIKQLLDRPTILLAMDKASAVGLEDTERERGVLPDHLRGAIPIGDEGVLTTRGLNPFETPATIAKTLGGLFGSGQSLFGPDTVGSQLGPIPGIAAETLTGKELFGGAVRMPFSRTQENPEGAEVPIGARPFTQFFGNLPITGLAERGVEDLRDVERGESMYEPGFLQYLALYMGLPYRNLNTQVAQSRGLEERARANQPAQTVGLFG